MLTQPGYLRIMEPWIEVRNYPNPCWVIHVHVETITEYVSLCDALQQSNEHLPGHQCINRTPTIPMTCLLNMPASKQRKTSLVLYICNYIPCFANNMIIEWLPLSCIYSCEVITQWSYHCDRGCVITPCDINGPFAMCVAIAASWLTQASFLYTNTVSKCSDTSMAHASPRQI